MYCSTGLDDVSARAAGGHTNLRLTTLIPALNEAAWIEPVLLHTRAVLPPHELVVVDGGSIDETVQIARQHARVFVCTAPRGSALNAAARTTRGDVLLFLHADTRLPVDAADQMVRILSDRRAVGGAFRFSFEERSPMATVIGQWVNFRSRVFGVFFGDQALFVRKDVFLQAGGFRDWNLMEDFEILRRLRRFGSLRLARSAIATSARRHLHDGWFSTMATVWMVTWLHLLGVPPAILSSLYRRMSRASVSRPRPT